MSMVIAIHNAVNEQTWQDAWHRLAHLPEILKYERLHQDHCAEPKLVRFLGRPGEMTPKASAARARALELSIVAMPLDLERRPVALRAAQGFCARQVMVIGFPMA
eukprot:Skav233661  [mRNA]  locus=scaffold2779:1144374:1147318:- [translate_table: standard]